MASMMKSSESLVSSVLSMLIIILLVVVQNQVGVVDGQADTCSAGLANLNVCTPFVVVGSTNPPPPNAECCNALQSVNRDCLCSTLRVASRLPSQCNIPPLTCPGSGNLISLSLTHSDTRVCRIF